MEVDEEKSDEESNLRKKTSVPVSPSISSLYEKTEEDADLEFFPPCSSSSMSAGDFSSDRLSSEDEEEEEEDGEKWVVSFLQLSQILPSLLFSVVTREPSEEEEEEEEEKDTSSFSSTSCFSPSIVTPEREEREKERRKLRKQAMRISSSSPSPCSDHHPSPSSSSSFVKEISSSSSSLSLLFPSSSLRLLPRRLLAWLDKAVSLAWRCIDTPRVHHRLVLHFLHSVDKTLHLYARQCLWRFSSPLHLSSLYLRQKCSSSLHKEKKSNFFSKKTRQQRNDLDSPLSLSSSPPAFLSFFFPSSPPVHRSSSLSSFFTTESREDQPLLPFFLCEDCAPATNETLRSRRRVNRAGRDSVREKDRGKSGEEEEEEVRKKRLGVSRRRAKEEDEEKRSEEVLDPDADDRGEKQEREKKKKKREGEKGGEKESVCTVGQQTRKNPEKKNEGLKNERESLKKVQACCRVGEKEEDEEREKMSREKGEEVLFLPLSVLCEDLVEGIVGYLLLVAYAVEILSLLSCHSWESLLEEKGKRRRRGEIKRDEEEEEKKKKKKRKDSVYEEGQEGTTREGRSTSEREEEKRNDEEEEELRQSSSTGEGRRRRREEEEEREKEEPFVLWSSVDVDSFSLDEMNSERQYKLYIQHILQSARNAAKLYRPPLASSLLQALQTLFFSQFSSLKHSSEDLDDKREEEEEGKEREGMKNILSSRFPRPPLSRDIEETERSLHVGISGVRTPHPLPPGSRPQSSCLNNFLHTSSSSSSSFSMLDELKKDVQMSSPRKTSKTKQQLRDREIEEIQGSFSSSSLEKKNTSSRRNGKIKRGEGEDRDPGDSEGNRVTFVFKENFSLGSPVDTKRDEEEEETKDKEERKMEMLMKMKKSLERFCRDVRRERQKKLRDLVLSFQRKRRGKKKKESRRKKKDEQDLHEGASSSSSSSFYSSHSSVSSERESREDKSSSSPSSSLSASPRRKRRRKLRSSRPSRRREVRRNAPPGVCTLELLRHYQPLHGGIQDCQFSFSTESEEEIRTGKQDRGRKRRERRERDDAEDEEEATRRKEEEMRRRRREVQGSFFWNGGYFEGDSQEGFSPGSSHQSILSSSSFLYLSDLLKDFSLVHPSSQNTPRSFSSSSSPLFLPLLAMCEDTSNPLSSLLPVFTAPSFLTSSSSSSVFSPSQYDAVSSRGEKYHGRRRERERPPGVCTPERIGGEEDDGDSKVFVLPLSSSFSREDEEAQTPLVCLACGGEKLRLFTAAEKEEEEDGPEKTDKEKRRKRDRREDREDEEIETSSSMRNEDAGRKTSDASEVSSSCHSILPPIVCCYSDLPLFTSSSSSSSSPLFSFPPPFSSSAPFYRRELRNGADTFRISSSSSSSSSSASSSSFSFQEKKRRCCLNRLHRALTSFYGESIPSRLLLSSSCSSSSSSGVCTPDDIDDLNDSEVYVHPSRDGEDERRERRRTSSSPSLFSRGIFKKSSSLLGSSSSLRLVPDFFSLLPFLGDFFLFIGQEDLWRSGLRHLFFRRILMTIESRRCSSYSFPSFSSFSSSSSSSSLLLPCLSQFIADEIHPFVKLSWGGGRQRGVSTHLIQRGRKQTRRRRRDFLPSSSLFSFSRSASFSPPIQANEGRPSVSSLSSSSSSSLSSSSPEDSSLPSSPPRLAFLSSSASSFLLPSPFAGLHHLSLFFLDFSSSSSSLDIEQRACEAQEDEEEEEDQLLLSLMTCGVHLLKQIRKKQMQDFLLHFPRSLPAFKELLSLLLLSRCRSNPATLRDDILSIFLDDSLSYTSPPWRRHFSIEEKEEEQMEIDSLDSTSSSFLLQSLFVDKRGDLSFSLLVKFYSTVLQSLSQLFLLSFSKSSSSLSTFLSFAHSSYRNQLSSAFPSSTSSSSSLLSLSGLPQVSPCYKHRNLSSFSSSSQAESLLQKERRKAEETGRSEAVILLPPLDLSLFSLSLQILLMKRLLLSSLSFSFLSSTSSLSSSSSSSSILWCLRALEPVQACLLTLFSRRDREETIFSLLPIIYEADTLAFLTRRKKNKMKKNARFLLSLQDEDTATQHQRRGSRRRASRRRKEDVEDLDVDIEGWEGREVEMIDERAEREEDDHLDTAEFSLSFFSSSSPQSRAHARCREKREGEEEEEEGDEKTKRKKKRTRIERKATSSLLSSSSPRDRMREILSLPSCFCHLVACLQEVSSSSSSSSRISSFLPSSSVSCSWREKEDEDFSERRRVGYGESLGDEQEEEQDEAEGGNKKKKMNLYISTSPLGARESRQSWINSCVYTDPFMPVDALMKSTQCRAIEEEDEEEEEEEAVLHALQELKQEESKLRGWLLLLLQSSATNSTKRHRASMQPSPYLSPSSFPSFLPSSSSSKLLKKSLYRALYSSSFSSPLSSSLFLDFYINLVGGARRFAGVYRHLLAKQLLHPRFFYYSLQTERSASLSFFPSSSSSNASSPYIRRRSERGRRRREDHDRDSISEEEQGRTTSIEEEEDVRREEEEERRRRKEEEEVERHGNPRRGLSSQGVCIFNDSPLQTPSSSLPLSSFPNCFLHRPVFFKNEKEEEEEKEGEIFSSDAGEHSRKKDVVLKKEKEDVVIEDEFEREERCAATFLRKLDELTQYIVKGLVEWRDTLSGEEEEEEERFLDRSSSSSSLACYSPLTLKSVAPGGRGGGFSLFFFLLFVFRERPKKER